MGYTLCVLGCGTMGIAIISGMISSLEARPINGNVNKPAQSGTSTPLPSYMLYASDDTLPSRFIATVRRPESAKKLKKLFDADFMDRGSELIEVTFGANIAAAKECDVLLLCCKPQLAAQILSEEGMQDALKNKLVISIMAGVTISQMESWLDPSTRIVRAMPNTPSKIREGMTVVTPITKDQPLDREILLAIFSSIGRCRFLEEKHFDACTALCGSGPAFVCVVLEALADGGVMMGMPRAEALELAAQMMQGTARMVLQTGTHPAAIKDSVTTPGGCTIAGLLSLEDNRVRSTIARAVQVATVKAHDLGQPTGEK
ncbi:pyrroline-5-carboxylate reductase [Clavulina sp. PMI_390]|nr:pyrroline-5-carboxylate reductase [Clavulina sp. PMI_390]